MLGAADSLQPQAGGRESSLGMAKAFETSKPVPSGIFSRKATLLNLPKKLHQLKTKYPNI